MNNNEFIHKINTSLKPLNDRCQIEGLKEKYPNIYIIGLPRSGTTLLTQLLFNGLNIQCTSNFISKFWDAPLVGFTLAKQLIGSYKPSIFSSDYGKNSDIYSPHEFSYFWHNILNFGEDQIGNIDYDKLAKGINWENLRNVIININEITCCPIVYKPLELIAKSLSEFQYSLHKSLFVYIERNPKDVAFSLAKGRLDYYNDIDTWFSSLPPEHAQIKKLHYSEQIALQVKGLRDLYEDSLKELSIENLVRVNYDQMCMNPASLLKEVRDKMNNLSDYEVKIEGEIPDKFDISTPKLQDEKISDHLIKALNKYQLI